MVDESRRDVVLKSMAFALVGDLLVACHNEAPPADSEWDAWIERGRTGKHVGILVNSDGGAPNSAQRARLSKMVAAMAEPPPFVLLTNSALLRSLLTALSWLLPSNQRLRALPPEALQEAISWLGVSVPSQHVGETIARLRGALASGRA